jgi:uncharacterized membrane protein YGL010W
MKLRNALAISAVLILVGWNICLYCKHVVYSKMLFGGGLALVFVGCLFALIAAGSYDYLNRKRQS